jgi:hypothetical protein
MDFQNNFFSITSLLIRWTARIFSLVVIIFLILFAIGGSEFTRSITESGWAWAGLLFFPLGTSVGMLLSWWREGLGAAVTAGSLVIFYLINYLGWGTFPSGPFFLLFSAPGFLFGISWILDPDKTPFQKDA